MTKLTGSVALAVLLLTGCGSAPQGGPPPRSLAERAYEDAARDLAAQITSHSIRGWPAHMTLSGEPPMPRLRLGTLRNESRTPLDLDVLRGELTQRLLEGGKVSVATTRDEHARVDEERAAVEDEPTVMSTEERVVSLLVTGSVRDDLQLVDGDKTHTMMVELRLLDVRDMSILLQARGGSSEVLED